jgi:hypothetical protein
MQMPVDNPSQEPVRAYSDEIRALTSMTGFPESEVRSVFETEFSRLSSGAIVDSYLIARTLSNVMAVLRRRSLAPNGGERSR